MLTSKLTESSRKRKSESLVDGNQSGKKGSDDDDVIVSCPYLDTIQRSVLDFDFEAACSVSVQAGPHIYACLVCGKYYRGRGPRTPAYTHAVEESHYIFCHLQKSTFHCLPDDYEIQDSSLQDIRDALHPTFTDLEIARIDYNTELSRDLYGRLYLPGFVGLNNLHKTDCVNTVVQALAHVRPLRNFFLRQTHDDNTLLRMNISSASSSSSVQLQALHVTRCFGELVRKIWSDKRFKSHVDPHQLVNAVASASRNKYRIGQQIEVGEFMAWFLHQLHLGTGGTNSKKKKKKELSIVEKVFQGTLQVTTRRARRKKKVLKEDSDDDRAGSDAEVGDEPDKKVDSNDADEDELQVDEAIVDNQFLQLTLEISEKPLFRDEDGGLVIPQEPLVTVLKKFDGVTFSDSIIRGEAQRRKYNIQKLPDFLILHLARFKTNQYSREKNPTIVAFPVKNLDLSDYVQPAGDRPTPPNEDEIRNMNVSMGVYFVWLTNDTCLNAICVSLLACYR